MRFSGWSWGGCLFGEVGDGELVVGGCFVAFVGDVLVVCFAFSCCVGRGWGWRVWWVGVGEAVGVVDYFEEVHVVDSIVDFSLSVCGSRCVVFVCDNTGFGLGAFGVFVVCSRGGEVEGYFPVFV